jgi:hypothetical protein
MANGNEVTYSDWLAIITEELTHAFNEQAWHLLNKKTDTDRFEDWARRAESDKIASLYEQYEGKELEAELAKFAAQWSGGDYEGVPYDQNEYRKELWMDGWGGSGRYRSGEGNTPGEIERWLVEEIAVTLGEQLDTPEQVQSAIKVLAGQLMRDMGRYAVFPPPPPATGVKSPFADLEGQSLVSLPEERKRLGEDLYNDIVELTVPIKERVQRFPFAVTTGRQLQTYFQVLVDKEILPKEILDYIAGQLGPGAATAAPGAGLMPERTFQTSFGVMTEQEAQGLFQFYLYNFQNFADLLDKNLAGTTIPEDFRDALEGLVDSELTKIEAGTETETGLRLAEDLIASTARDRAIERNQQLDIDLANKGEFDQLINNRLGELGINEELLSDADKNALKALKQSLKTSMENTINADPRQQAIDQVKLLDTLTQERVAQVLGAGREEALRTKLQGITGPELKKLIERVLNINISDELAAQMAREIGNIAYSQAPLGAQTLEGYIANYGLANLQRLQTADEWTQLQDSGNMLRFLQASGVVDVTRDNQNYINMMTGIASEAMQQAQLWNPNARPSNVINQIMNQQAGLPADATPEQQATRDARLRQRFDIGAGPPRPTMETSPNIVGFLNDPSQYDIVVDENGEPQIVPKTAPTDEAMVEQPVAADPKALAPYMTQPPVTATPNILAPYMAQPPTLAAEQSPQVAGPAEGYPSGSLANIGIPGTTPRDIRGGPALPGYGPLTNLDMGSVPADGAVPAVYKPETLDKGNWHGSPEPMPLPKPGDEVDLTLLGAFNGNAGLSAVPESDTAERIRRAQEVVRKQEWPSGPTEGYDDLRFELPPGSLDPDVYGEGLTQLDIMEAVKELAGKDPEYFRWLYSDVGPLGGGEGQFNLASTIKEFQEAQQQGIDELFQIIGGPDRKYPSAPLTYHAQTPEVQTKTVTPQATFPTPAEIARGYTTITPSPFIHEKVVTPPAVGSGLGTKGRRTYIGPQQYAGMVAQEVAARPKLSFKEFLGQKQKAYQKAYAAMQPPTSKKTRRGRNILVRSI